MNRPGSTPHVGERHKIMSDTLLRPEEHGHAHMDQPEQSTWTKPFADSLDNDTESIHSVLTSRASIFRPHHIFLGFMVDSEMSESHATIPGIGHRSLYMAGHDGEQGDGHNREVHRSLPQLPRAHTSRERNLSYSYFGAASGTTLQDDGITSAHYRNDSGDTITAAHYRNDSGDTAESTRYRSDSNDSYSPLKTHKREGSMHSRQSEEPLVDPVPIKMSAFQEAMFIGVVAVSHFVTQAGLGMNLAPLDIISQTFRTTSLGQQAWMIAGYSLTVGTFILIAGRMGDIWGHKRMLAFGYAWFGVWSGFAGFAAYTKLQVLFDICRGLQGIGPALIMPNGLALFGRAYAPGVKKNIVFSIFGAVAPAGFVTGATFGSLFAQLTWWPWAFWSFGIALWFLAALSLLVVPRELSGLPKSPPKFDWTGSFLGVAGLVLINVAWNNGPLYGWGTPNVYFLLIIGLLFLAAFFWAQSKTEQPLVPLKAINGTVSFILVCIGLGWGAFGVWVFYSFRFLAQIRLATPLSASAQFVPAAIFGFVAAAATAYLLTHTPVSFVMMASMVAFAGGIAATATMPAQQIYWAQMFVAVIIMPFGMDMSFPAASVILSNHMGPEHQGLAMSLVNTVVNYSISIALGIAGTVESRVVDHTNTSREELLKGYRAGLYTAVALSCTGVLCGVLFLLRSLRKEGWKVMDH